MATRSDALSVSVRKDFHTVAHSSGIALDEATRALVADVGKVHGEVNWVALTYAKGSKQALELLGSGSGGFAELSSSGAFENARVVYAVFVAVAGRRGGRKKVFVSWVGPDVSGLERARVSLHRTDVLNLLGPAVASLDLQEHLPSAAAFDDWARAAVAEQLFVPSDSLLLDSNLAAKAAGFGSGGDAENVAAAADAASVTPSELEPLPGLPPSAASAEEAMEALACLAQQTGLSAPAATQLLAELPPSLAGEALLLAQHMDGCTPELAAELLTLAAAAATSGELASPVPATLAAGGALVRGCGLRLALAVVLRCHLLGRPMEWRCTFGRLPSTLPTLTRLVECARATPSSEGLLRTRQQGLLALTAAALGRIGLAVEPQEEEPTPSPAPAPKPPPARPPAPLP
eukprot:jgi/Chrpa1/5534/Chrysochromulina_OHIO_Genome00011174-RA